MNYKQLRFDAIFAQLHLALSGKTATYVVIDGDLITVTYHLTRIVRVYYGKDIDSFNVVLFSGGWRTRTTKRRINQVFAAIGAQWRIVQEKGNWYVISNEFDNIRIPFVDGMNLLV
jgi:hypothetical protein